MPATFLPTAYLNQPVIFDTGHFSNPFSPPRRLPTSHFCQLATVLLSTTYFSQPDISFKRTLFTTLILLPLDSFFNNIFLPTWHVFQPVTPVNWLVLLLHTFCSSVWVAEKCSHGKSVWVAIVFDWQKCFIGKMLS